MSQGEVSGYLNGPVREYLYSYPRQIWPSKSVSGVEIELALLCPEQNVIRGSQSDQNLSRVLSPVSGPCSGHHAGVQLP